MTALKRYFFDTEFRDLGGFRIDFISIGIVADDSREFYAIHDGFDLAAASQDTWVAEHVLSKLPPAQEWQSLEQIRNGILDLIESAEEIELWAKNGAYDYFALCSLFGGLMNFHETLRREKGIQRVIPRDSNELRRMFGQPNVTPQPESEKHSAIADARQEKREYDSYWVFPKPGLSSPPQPPQPV